MLRLITSLLACLSWFSSLAFAAYAQEVSLRLVQADQGQHGIDERSLSSCLDAAAHGLTTVDPNFKTDGSLLFKGCDLSSQLTNLAPKTPVTIIGSDQYILATSVATLTANQALIARTAGGLVIPANRGGPVKLVMKPGATAESFVWYVRAIVIGTSFADKLLITRQGKAIGSLALANQADRTTIVLPAPRGSRHDIASGASNDTEIRAEALALAAVTALFGNAKTATIHDLAGNKRAVDLQQVASELLVACTSQNKPLTILQGGPCMIVSKGKLNRWLPLAFVTQIDLD